MTDKFIPEVGSIIEAQVFILEQKPGAWIECEVLKVNRNGMIAVLFGDTLCWACNVRPIKSEADKLRDEQIKEMAYLCRSMDSGLITAASMYKAGCRMTRELTPEVREKLRTQFILEAISEDPDAFIDLVAAYVRGELDMESPK